MVRAHRSVIALLTSGHLRMQHSAMHAVVPIHPTVLTKVGSSVPLCRIRQGGCGRRLGQVLCNVRKTLCEGFIVVVAVRLQHLKRSANCT